MAARRIEISLGDHMKAVPMLTVLSALLTGTMAWHQHFETVKLSELANSMTVELQKKAALVEGQEILLDRLQKEIDDEQAEIDSLQNATDIGAPFLKPAENAQLSSTPAPSKNNEAEVLARIANDPTMREITRQWHLTKVKEIYGDFVKDRHFSPIQTKQFFDLLTEEMTRSKDEYFSLFATGEADTGPTNTRIEFWKNQKDEIERPLRMLLGDDDYAVLEQYRGSTGD
jgi:hypothetical protein